MLGGETKSSLVKAAAGKELAARGECHTVHRLLMPAEDRSGSKCKRVTLLVGWNTMSNLLVSQTSSKYGRRCLFQRPTAAQWSQSWQRRAPEDRVVSIRSGTTGIIFISGDPRKSQALVLTRFMFGFCVPGPVGLHFMV